MPPLAEIAREGVPALGLLVLLVTAIRHPSGRVEASVAVLAGAATLATGLLTVREAEDVARHLGPVILFLMTILVVGEVCARAGVFASAAQQVARVSRGRAVVLMSGVFVLAAVVTAVLSLDATVVLLMPVVIGASVAMDDSPWPAAHTCLRMANSASLLLPVSNLTNLLAIHHLDLTFAGFAARMAPVLLAVLVVEYVVLRWLFRDELRAVGHPVEGPDSDQVPPWTPIVVVLLMLVGFAVVSPLGVEPFWVSAVAALVLVVWAGRRALLTTSTVVRAAHPGFAVFVLALGVVVAALAAGPLGELVTAALPGHATSYLDLAAIAVIATLLAGLVTNLSATLLLVPLLVPFGPTAILAALLGLNIGSGLTWTGSLANLLWRRGLVRLGNPPTTRDFHRVSLAVTPVSLAAGVAVLAWWPFAGAT